MSLKIPTYPSSYSPTPLVDAYAWITSLTIDFKNSGGNVLLQINRDTEAAASGYPPDSALNLYIGSQLPSLEQFITDNYESFQNIRTYIYDQIKTLPAFSGAVDVE